MHCCHDKELDKSLNKTEKIRTCKGPKQSLQVLISSQSAQSLYVSGALLEKNGIMWGKFSSGGPPPL